MTWSKSANSNACGSPASLVSSVVDVIIGAPHIMRAPIVSNRNHNECMHVDGVATTAEPMLPPLLSQRIWSAACARWQTTETEYDVLREVHLRAHSARSAKM
jgi:hypothetical protein